MSKHFSIPKVLIVDDSCDNALAMSDVLEDLNVKIITADSGLKAIELFHENQFSLVLMDVQMPGMSGIETVKALKKEKNLSLPPIVFVTGHKKDPSESLEGYGVGAVDYLFKPVEPHLLKAKVKAILEISNNHALKAESQEKDRRRGPRAGQREGEELHRLAYNDAVTGIANRHQFESMLLNKIEESKDNGEKFALLFLDLDNFKAINDSFGHHVGDELLRLVAKRLQSLIGEDCSLYRLGGDEFSIVFSPIKEDAELHPLTDKIKSIFTEALPIHEHNIHVSFSIGIACYPTAAQNYSALMRAADIAMYTAKEKGKNQACFYTKEIDEMENQKGRLEQALRTAIQNKELYLVWQPIFNLETRAPVGAEALLRWRSQAFGEMLPKQFIPIAEQAGLIADIGGWVLKAAFDEVQKWNSKGYKDLLFAINLSEKQLAKFSFDEEVDRLLKEYTFDPSCIALEVVEDSLIRQNEKKGQLMDKLSALGIQIILDDFGTGYSSLMRLKSLPIYALKVDASFVKNIEDDKGSDAMVVRAILSIAKNLRFQAIAEGVEEESQLDFLIRNECLYGQGFYLKKPHTVEGITKLWEDFYGKP